MYPFLFTATSKSNTIRPFIMCTTTYVVYMLQWPFGLQYVGRTTQASSVRCNEHIYNINRGFKHHSVSRHYGLVHNKDPSGKKIMGIDKYVLRWRGSVKKREISKLETKGINLLKLNTLYGLNMDWDVNAFIDNFSSCYSHLFGVY